MFIYSLLSVAADALQLQRHVVKTETLWPTKKTNKKKQTNCTIWTFTKKKTPCQPMLEATLPLGSPSTFGLVDQKVSHPGLQQAGPPTCLSFPRRAPSTTGVNERHSPSLHCPPLPSPAVPSRRCSTPVASPRTRGPEESFARREIFCPQILRLQTKFTEKSCSHLWVPLDSILPPPDPFPWKLLGSCIPFILLSGKRGLLSGTPGSQAWPLERPKKQYLEEIFPSAGRDRLGF